MYNQIVLIGNLGNDPELREVSGGIPFTSFSLAVNRRWTTAEGQAQEKTNWFHVTAWNKQAEFVKQYFVKGRPIMIIGEISGSRTFTDREGNMRATIDVRAKEVRFVEGRRDDQDVARTENSEQPEAAEAKVPF